MLTDKRLLLLLVISVLATLSVLSFGPINQDSNYHQFADNRTLAAIPNFFNLASNLPFMAVGFLGIRFTLSQELNPNDIPLRKAYFLFYIGVFLSGLGSSYYHFRPDNSSLLWDRLPIAVSFMSFFCLVTGKCISPAVGLRLLPPLLVLGISSVVYWYISESAGHGDLRPYILVQFLPILLIPLILLLYGRKQKNCNFVWAVLFVYLLSKIAESFDWVIYHHLYVISGHTLKHLLAALGAYVVYAASKSKPGRG